MKYGWGPSKRMTIGEQLTREMVATICMALGGPSQLVTKPIVFSPPCKRADEDGEGMHSLKALSILWNYRLVSLSPHSGEDHCLTIFGAKLVIEPVTARHCLLLSLLLFYIFFEVMRNGQEGPNYYLCGLLVCECEALPVAVERVSNWDWNVRIGQEETEWKVN